LCRGHTNLTDVPGNKPLNSERRPCHRRAYVGWLNQLELIAGNHGRHFNACDLGFEIIIESLRMHNILLRHQSDVIDDLCDGRQKFRLPSFRFSEHGGLLPAFGALTGSHETPPKPNERVVAVTPSELVPIADLCSATWNSCLSVARLFNGMQGPTLTTIATDQYAVRPTGRDKT
jgi:hypothetical protein